MKERYKWECLWDVGHGDDRELCFSRSSESGCKTEQAAMKSARAHANKYRHDTVNVYREIFKYRRWRVDWGWNKK